MTKGLKVLAIVVLGFTACTYGALEVLSSRAQARVTVNVIPNISIRVISANIGNPDEGKVTLEVGRYRVGIIEAEILFHVIANVERLKFRVLATDLYKADDPSSLWKIPVRASSHVIIEASQAHPISGQSELLNWVKNISYSNGMNAWESEIREYESSRPRGTFNQDLSVKVEYESTDPKLPRGTYGGFVKLVCEIEPI